MDEHHFEHDGWADQLDDHSGSFSPELEHDGHQHAQQHHEQDPAEHVEYYEKEPGRRQTTKRAREAGEARRKNHPRFICPIPDCGATFTRSHNLAGHLRSHSGEQPFKCEVCGRGFSRRHDRKRHEKLHLTGGSKNKLTVVESLSHVYPKEPTPEQAAQTQDAAAFASMIASEEFVNSGASLQDLAIIIGNSDFTFPAPVGPAQGQPSPAATAVEIPLPPPPPPSPPTPPPPPPLPHDKESVHEAIIEYARVFPFVHASPPSQPPPPFPIRPSPFSQTLTPPEVLVWLSKSEWRDLAEATETLRLFGGLMGYVDGVYKGAGAGVLQELVVEEGVRTDLSSEESSPGSLEGAPAQQTPLHAAISEAPASEALHVPTMDDLVDPALFVQEHQHLPLHIDFPAHHSQAESSASGSQTHHLDESVFSMPDNDLLHAFPLPDEFNHTPGAPSHVPLPHAPLAHLDAADFIIPGMATNLQHAQPPPPAPPPRSALAKPPPPLRTGPRKPKPKLPPGTVHPCTYIDPRTGESCGKAFQRTFDLKRHNDTVHLARDYGASHVCQKCARKFTRQDALVRHQKLYCQRRVSENGKLQRTSQQHAYIPPGPIGVHLDQHHELQQLQQLQQDQHQHEDQHLHLQHSPHHLDLSPHPAEDDHINSHPSFFAPDEHSPFDTSEFPTAQEFAASLSFHQDGTMDVDLHDHH